MRKKKSTAEKLARWILLGIILVVAGILIKDYMKVTDVTSLVNASKSTLESTLNVELESHPELAKRIYCYTEKEVSLDGGDEGIGVVYVDGIPCGLHIDHRKYTMFGLHMGDSEIDVDNNLTYPYEGHFGVLDDYYDSGNSRGEFYYNKANNDCIVITYNDFTGRILAITYFNDFGKATETLSGV